MLIGESSYVNPGDQNLNSLYRRAAAPEYALEHLDFVEQATGETMCRFFLDKARFGIGAKMD